MARNDLPLKKITKPARADRRRSGGCGRRGILSALVLGGGSVRGLCAAVAVTVACGLATSLVNNAANDAFAANLTLTVPTDPLVVNVVPSAAGTFAESNAAQVKVSTDYVTGYELRMRASSLNFTNGSGGSLTPIKQEYTGGVSGTFATLAQPNTWGYKPSVFGGVSNSNYKVPSTSDVQINKTSGKTTREDTYNFQLGVKVNTSVASGIYADTMIFTVVANPFTYSITYDLNGGTGGPRNVAPTTTSGTSIVLEKTTPTNEGYTFQGWCTVATSNETCAGSVYQPGGTVNLTEAVTNLTLHAMWKQDKHDMQNFKCASISGRTFVTDSRDENVYAVEKLADGNCWMTENLRLGANTMTNRTLTPDDTNITTGTYTLPADSISSFYYNATDGLFVDTSNTSYGGYYTWTTATAGGDDYMGRVSDSICPKGWRLPTYDEYDALINAYGGNSAAGSAALQAQPGPGFVFGGTYYSSSSYPQSGQGSIGSYWSSSGYSVGEKAWFFKLNKSRSATMDHSDRWYGYSVRCMTSP